jgi:hypothetical protein
MALMGHTHKLDLNNNGLGAPTFLIFTLEANDLPSTLVFLFFLFFMQEATRCLLGCCLEFCHHCGAQENQWGSLLFSRL